MPRKPRPKGEVILHTHESGVAGHIPPPSVRGLVAPFRTNVDNPGRLHPGDPRILMGHAAKRKRPPRDQSEQNARIRARDRAIRAEGQPSPPHVLVPDKAARGPQSRPRIIGRTAEIRWWGQRLTFGDPVYVKALRKRLREGTAPHMEVLLAHYGYGKPTTEVKISGIDQRPVTIDIKALGVEELQTLSSLILKAQGTPTKELGTGRAVAGGVTQAT